MRIIGVLRIEDNFINVFLSIRAISGFFLIYFWMYFMYSFRAVQLQVISEIISIKDRVVFLMHDILII